MLMAVVCPRTYFLSQLTSSFSTRRWPPPSAWWAAMDAASTVTLTTRASRSQLRSLYTLYRRRVLRSHILLKA